MDNPNSGPSVRAIKCRPTLVSEDEIAEIQLQILPRPTDTLFLVGIVERGPGNGSDVLRDLMKNTAPGDKSCVEYFV